MDPKKLQAMLDHYEITQVLVEYCHGCDRADGEHMASVYAEESWDDHGHYKGDGKQFAREAVVNIATLRTCHHQLGQSLIKVDGDRAGAETYFIASLRMPTPEGGEILNQISGRYVDVLERIDGAWKVKHRTCVRDWSISLPVIDNWQDGVPFVEGQTSGDDVSYAVLGIRHSGRPRA
jgi:hypothetical protein